MAWYGMAWHGMAGVPRTMAGMLRYGMAWHGMAGVPRTMAGMLRYGMLWYGMAWHGRCATYDGRHVTRYRTHQIRTKPLFPDISYVLTTFPFI